MSNVTLGVYTSVDLKSVQSDWTWSWVVSCSKIHIEKVQ